ncbi:MAG TPA: AAA family ATPase [Acidobacteriota bacterium]|nr:AAA family ATPase [Acidobacteriota bacterium]
MKANSTTQRKHRELDASELKAVCDPASLPCETTSELETLSEMIGQDRASRAIQFGLGMKSFGYNLFVAGNPGTGKKTLIRTVVEEIAKKQPTPKDVFYVFNFEQPERPKAITVPPGVASRFCDAMEGFIEELKEDVPSAFKSEDYESRRNEIMQAFQRARGDLLEKVQADARLKGLAVKSAGSQLVSVPVANGKELSSEEYESLSPEDKEAIKSNQEEVSETIQEVYRTVRSMQDETQERLKELDQKVALIATGYNLAKLRKEFGEYEAILEYLGELQRDVIGNISDFLESEEERAAESAVEGGTPLKRYKVNVIVDNSKQKGAPVITETHPTYRNLIGYAEREAHMGTLFTDFTLIRAGSVLTANHGYLILDLVDLLATPLAWDSLKRVLQDGEVKIQDPDELAGGVGTLGLRPEPVSVDLKVVVLGSAELYGLLYEHDEDFQKLFKIKAEFGTVIKKNDNHLLQYARFVKTLCDKEGLKHFNREAVAALVEHSSRMVSDQQRLTLRFSDVADLVRESNYWADQQGRELVGREDLRRAIEEKTFRSNLYEELIQEMIDEGTILIDCGGRAVGQINGLSVYQVGDHSFGKPTRLTAQVGVGDKGVVNIEREAHMSGRVHDKGVLILSGYLHGKYGQNQPLSLFASICFEQSYSGVDGDSASSTELYAILSSLVELPLKQFIAVTGSINQKGVIQPIGGANEKIEGFFATCKVNGLTGDQGVIIPHQNVQNLMLNEEVIQAVREGKFHIYPIETVDEGMEILTDFEAGELQEDGTYPEGTVHDLVQKRLDEMAEIVLRRGGGFEEEDEAEVDETETEEAEEA